MQKYVRIYDSTWYSVDDFIEACSSDPDEIDHVDNFCDPASDDERTAVDYAVDNLVMRGMTQPSMVPGFGPDLWYTSPDGGHTYLSGRHVESSAHLYGFTIDEQRAIWAQVIDQ